MIAVAGLLGILVGFLGLMVFFFIIIRNKLANLNTMIKASWSEIDVRLRKRYDLVPDLVEMVKGYAADEKKVLEAVMEARSLAMQAASPVEKAKCENAFREALRGLFAAAEADPELKADANFLKLKTRLEELMETMERAREYYNNAVGDFNSIIETFPTNLVAALYKFRREEAFELKTPEAEKGPR